MLRRRQYEAWFHAWCKLTRQGTMCCKMKDAVLAEFAHAIEPAHGLLRCIATQQDLAAGSVEQRADLANLIRCLRKRGLRTQQGEFSEAISGRAQLPKPNQSPVAVIVGAASILAAGREARAPGVFGDR